MLSSYGYIGSMRKSVMTENDATHPFFPSVDDREGVLYDGAGFFLLRVYA